MKFCQSGTVTLVSVSAGYTLTNAIVKCNCCVLANFFLFPISVSSEVRAYFGKIDFAHFLSRYG